MTRRDPSSLPLLRMTGGAILALTFFLSGCTPPWSDGAKTRSDGARLPQGIKNENYCGIPRGCDVEYISQSDPRRHRYNPLIVDAANKWGIPPSLLKAQIHAETSFLSPQVENSDEKRAYLKRPKRLSEYMRAYKWGKGLGQFGANNAHLYGLAWDPKDVGKTVKVNRYGYTRPITLKNIFDPKASIEAKAMYLSELMNANFMFKISKRDESGKWRGQWIHAFANLKNTTEYYRFLVAAYNRGPNRIVDAVRDFYLKSHRLPKTYEELASHTLLKKFRVTQCHVARIVGLCDHAQGYLKKYMQDFAYNTRKGVYEIP